MFIFTVIMLVVVFALLLLSTGVQPARTHMSRFELERRSTAGDEVVRSVMHREGLLDDVLSLQRVLTALLLVAAVALAVAAFGWFLGIILAAVIALEYSAVARAGFVRQFAQPLYERYEAQLLSCIEKFPSIFRLIRNVNPDTDDNGRLDSREELQYLVDNSRAILSVNEKKLILHSLQFDNRLVSEVMTPRGMIDSIDKKELLGPLVLDDLHKTGHSRFPVTAGDIDHIVGVLHIQNLFTLGAKRSETVEKAMEQRVFYIREDQSLQHALSAFLRTHHHLFVVVNEFRETVGVISLEDVIEALLGRKIVDEFDAHDDLRAVAMRNPHANNRSTKSEDV